MEESAEGEHEIELGEVRFMLHFSLYSKILYAPVDYLFVACKKWPRQGGPLPVRASQSSGRRLLRESLSG